MSTFFNHRDLIFNLFLGENVIFKITYILFNIYESQTKINVIGYISYKSYYIFVRACTAAILLKKCMN